MQWRYTITALRPASANELHPGTNAVLSTYIHTKGKVMLQRPFKQVDVFTRMPFLGNPVAVVLDAQGLETEQMQRIANWTNLSETTFVLPADAPGADYRVRIFTPGSELSFAGHPTIGTAHALLEAGLVAAKQGKLIQECGAGLVPLRIDTDAVGVRSISFELPQPTASELSDLQTNELQAILGADLMRAYQPRLIDVGARWIIAQLKDAAAVLSVRPDFARMANQDRQANATGVVIFGAHEPGELAQVEVRAFAPSIGVAEDPVCGSGNGCVAVFIRDTDQIQRFGSSYTAAQGQVVGRRGQIRIGMEPAKITVGGSAVTCIDGIVTA